MADDRTVEERYAQVDALISVMDDRLRASAAQNENIAVLVRALTSRSTES